MKYITKRDGSKEPYNIGKIQAVIQKAFARTSENSDENIQAVLTYFVNHFSKLDTVEEIQDAVEKSLMAKKFYNTAKEFILYRKQRENIRNSKTSLVKTFKEVLNADGSDISRENANVDGKAPMGLMLLFGSEIEKDYVKRYMISPRFTELHESGDFHIHDLNMYACTFNCCNIGLKNLLEKGFSTGHGTIRPPQSIQTAMTIAAIVIQANQNDMFGGQGIPLFDYEISPYIAKSFGKRLKEVIEIYLGFDIKDNTIKDFVDALYDRTGTVLGNLDEVKGFIDFLTKENTNKVIEKAVKLTENDVFQACEGFVHNLNTLNSRCLPGSEIVIAKDGDKHMSELNENDSVLSFNVTYQRFEFKKVLNVFNNGHKKLLEVELEDGQTHRMTADHKVFTSEGFREIQDAKDILTSTGFAKILKKTEIPEETVYDIEVQDNHTFCIRDKNGFAVVHNCGSQVPFSSINYGTCKTREGQMLIENILRATDNGLGNKETSIFPVQIFKIKEGVNANPGDPNYYLYEMACKVSAKRMYPNFVNIDVPGNIEYYQEGKPETEMATMGALSGETKVTLFNYAADSGITLRFDEVENFITEGNFAGDPIQFDENTVYYNTESLFIYDNIANRYAEIKKFMKFKVTKPWYRIHCMAHGLNGHAFFDFLATEDHPLPVNGKRTLVSDLKEGDALEVSAKYAAEMLADVAEVIRIEKVSEDYVGYDFETSTDRFDTDYIVSHNCRTKTLAMLDGSARVTNRGNIAFTTINLPRLGIVSDHSVEKFFELLDQRITDCIDELLERVNYIKTKKVYNFPFLMGQNIYLGAENLGWNDTIEPALKNGTLAVGFIGIAEALKALTGKHHGESEESYELALKIVRTIRERTDKATKEYGWQFGCFATPAEGLSERFVKIDKKKFGVIEGVTDREFYTNSFHIPVYYPVTASEKMQKEGVFHELCNAGAITYVEMDGDPLQNLQAFKKIVDYSRKCGISYFSVNHNVDRCPICGFQGIIESDVCPNCGWKEGSEISLEELEAKGIDTKRFR